MTQQLKDRIKNFVSAALLFTLAFVPRYMGLGRIIVADEQLWIGRSIRFFKSLIDFDLMGTSQSGHPGVITMWLSGISIGLKHLIDGSKSVGDLLFAGQFPIALMTSVSVVIMYFLIRKVFDEMTAIIASILIAIDPFFIALSRIIHLDALTTCFMTLSVLSFMVFLKESNKRYLLFSSICTGLGVLAKIPAVFLYGFIGLVILLEFISKSVNDNLPVKESIPKYFKIYTLWFIISIGVIFAFWPAMWSDPMVFLRLFLKGPGMVAHEHGQYFLGHPLDDPGFLYYFVVILFRTTPIVLIFSTLSAAILIWKGFSNYKRLNRNWFNLLLLTGYVILFISFMSFPAKKVGRYILPVFPMLSVLAAIGIIKILNGITEAFSNRKSIQKYAFSIVTVIILAVQTYPLFKIHPYEFSYYNPLTGGPSKAKEFLLVGRGEGLDLVGEYLNKKVNARDLTVASEFSYLLRVYFKGKVESLKIEEYEKGTLDNIDYLVIYISGLQKEHLRIPLEAIEYHRTHSPEHIVVINGIEYAYIYNMGREM
jgi:hypothetical protein